MAPPASTTTRAVIRACVPVDTRAENVKHPCHAFYTRRVKTTEYARTTSQAAAHANANKATLDKIVK